MTYDYDDWYEENAPCSTGSLPAWHSRFLRTSRNALSAARLPVMLPLITLGCVLAALGFATGCGSRTVLVPESAVLRVAPSVRGYAYLWDAEAQEWRMGGKMIDYPEGWYLVPPSYVEEEEPLGGATGATMPNLGARR